MNKLKRVIDMLMTILLMCLMAFQVTGEMAHEWIGIMMVITVIVHQILNIKWYSAIFKGKYNLYRIFSTIINVLLIASFFLTAISGMSMSNHAVPFLYGLINVNNARIMHLAFSYWSFILMGLHLGMHISLMTSKMPKNIKMILAIVMTIVSGYGLSVFIRSGIIDYISFKSHFAFLDYEKNYILVFLENLSMLIAFAFIGHNTTKIIKHLSKNNLFIIVVMLMLIGCSYKSNEVMATGSNLSGFLAETNMPNNNEGNMEKLKLFIDNTEVDVRWENNASMKQIRELAKQKPLEINCHRYGGFEQVGEIGQDIVSNNTQMTTEAGDIVLYAGSNIVVFYGNNSWSYTKLGKINKTKEELKTMLDKKK